MNTHHPAPPAPTQHASAHLSGITPISFLDVVGILRRRAPLVLITFAVTVAAALYVTSRMTKTYEATTKLLLNSPPAVTMPSSVLDLVLNGKTSSSSDVELAKIKSRGFLSEVIRKAGIGAETTPEDLKNRLQVGLTGDRILDITATMKKDPELAARVANTAAEVYREYVIQEDDREIERSSERLRRAAKKAEAEKDAANRELQAFMAKRGVSDPKSFYIRQSEKTLQVRNALQDAERDVAVRRKDIGLFERQVNTIPPTVISGTSLNRNGQIEQYQDQIIALENERKVKLNDFGPQSLEIQEIDNKIDAARRSLQSLQSNAFRQGGYGISRNPDYSAARSNLIRAKQEVEQIESNIVALRKQLRELQAEQFELASERVRYQELQLRVDVTSEAYAKSNSALLQIPITRITSVKNIDVLEEARVPTGPVSPKPLLNMILAIFSGAFLGVLFAILAEYFATTPKSADGVVGIADPMLPQLPAAPYFAGSLPAVAGVPLLARVALSGGRSLSGKAEYGLPATGTDAATEDAFREIGYLLSHPDTADPNRVPVVVLAGTRTDETTASVAAYLTATLVRDGLRVTLVDGDRTDPRLHEVFGKPDAPGVTDILAGRVSAAEALHVGAGGSLRFLAAGAKSDPTPLTEESLRALYNELGRTNDTDLVIISGPSVWSARLVAPMERAADGVVLVAPAAPVTPEESVARARRILTNGYQPRLLGVIVGEDSAKEPSVLAAKAEKIRGENIHEK